MSLTIAIQPDSIIDRLGNRQSYSARWTELAANAGIRVRQVDVYRPDWLAQVEGTDALMWRCGPTQFERQLAKRLVPALEQGLGIRVFPNWRTIWHLEDKLAQYFLLSAAHIPIPCTSVIWDRESAMEYIATASYPFVFKLAYGYQSTNVSMVNDANEARYWIDQMFGPGLQSLGYRPTGRLGMLKRRLRATAQILVGRHPHAPNSEAGIEHGYFYAQQFLPGNAFDTRITIIGDRAFGFRRMNRPGDFRASGSGIANDDFDHEKVDTDAIRLAFRTVRALGADTLATDILRNEEGPVVGEVGSAYPAWTMSLYCPGHWVLHGDPGSGQLQWVQGKMRTEDALFSTFLDNLAVRDAEIVLGSGSA